MIVHATVDQLAGEPWNVTADNAAVLLRSASLLVDRALIGAIYTTDDDGVATDATVLQALQDATCAQAATWAALGIDPTGGAAGATAGQVVRKSIGSATVEYDRGSTGRSTAGDARADAAVTLTDEAAQILANAGLLTTRVWTYG